MAVFITATVIIYFLFIIFSIYAAVQQIKSNKLRNSSPEKKFALFQQNKMVLVTVAKSTSLCVVVSAFLLIELPEVLWSMNQTLSKILSFYGICNNDSGVWTVMLPILTLYLFYEMHYQWTLKSDSRERCEPSLTMANRIGICIIGIHFVTTCIILEDNRKILSLFTALSLGRLLFPFLKYRYVLWAYPVQPMTDPWLCQETSDIARRNRITVKQILIVKYPCMDCQGVQCLFGNLLVDSKLLLYQSEFIGDLPRIPRLNGNYAPTISQKEVRTMIIHGLGRWVNNYDLKMSLICICQLVGIAVALTLSNLLSSELGQTSDISMEMELMNEDEISAILQDQRLRASCMGIIGVLFCAILPIAYSSHLIQSIYRQRLNVKADLFTLTNFQGKQQRQQLIKKAPAEMSDFSGRHWIYRIIYPNREAMIVERIDILKDIFKRIMYF